MNLGKDSLLKREALTKGALAELQQMNHRMKMLRRLVNDRNGVRNNESLVSKVGRHIETMIVNITKEQRHVQRMLAKFEDPETVKFGELPPLPPITIPAGE